MTDSSDPIKLREKKRKEVFQQLQNDFSLPSPTGTVMEVIRLCHSDTSSLHDIAELIQTDPALSAEIIKYANSALLSTGVQVASIQKATVNLGLKTVVNLALGFSLLSANKAGACRQFDYPLFWRTSLAEALAARALAASEKDLDGDELFVCGLLCHMGALSLATIFPGEYGQLLEEHSPDPIALAEERQAFGIDSAELTLELFLQWGLPAKHALAAGFHEYFEEVELGSGATRRGAIILSLAHLIAGMCQSKEPRLDLLHRLLNTAKNYSVDLSDFPSIFSTIVESWHEHGRLLDITTSECYPYNEDDI